MTNEPKKTQLGWSVQEQPYAQLLEQHQQQQQAAMPRAPRGSDQPLTTPNAYAATQYDYNAYYTQQQHEQLAQQQQYAQQYPQQPQTQHEMHSHVQQQYAQAQQYQEQQYAQQQYDHAIAQQQWAQQQYAQQQYVQPQPPPQPTPAPVGGALGSMAAKLQKRAEKQKAKLEAALKKEDKKTEDKAGRTIPDADATMGQSARRRFIKQTYLHLFAAIVAFSALLWTFMNVGPVRALLEPFVRFALGGRWNWGIVLLAFMAVSWVADNWASHAKSRGMQYAGLAFYVIAEAVIFVPLLAIVEWKTAGIISKGGGDPNIVRDAAFLTLAVFGLLTASVVLSKKDFSFLRSGLVVATGAAITLIALSLIFGFNLGLVFSVAMVVLAAGYILFQTSQVLAHYDPESHVAASLALFSSVALMFWYMIRILMRARE